MEITICISTLRKTAGLNLPGHVQHPVGIAPESLDRNNISRRCCWRTNLKQALKKHGHFPKSNRAHASRIAWLGFLQDAPIFPGCCWLEVRQGSPWGTPKFARSDDGNRFYRGRWTWRETWDLSELILLFPFAKLFSPYMCFLHYIITLQKINSDFFPIFWYSFTRYKNEKIKHRRKRFTNKKRFVIISLWKKKPPQKNFTCIKFPIS